ncbi:4Fe-4S binding protein [Methanococcus voltae]|uniref:Energy-converting hydrogenase B subunit L n=2 Tax=Methanococcus voltae TaxID=2188 RepID=A0A8J7S3A2_METVO|nr:4Fe-4S binding protein [Methanococcus voltae]MBP2172314.1 energy-converting hydrogenase B subunit L [Methanococcus voltae]MBP2200730.1 energy-converting hydrogenase B subunit L [Methanococcus voltae]MCS3921454.1 energy-converting hydrogenase B subunit L [Methanococcus voltae PS]
MDSEVRELSKIFISGFYRNLERIILGTGRYTSKEMTESILKGIELPENVLKDICIGCGGCANACPTKAITMEEIAPIKLTEEYSKESIPVIDAEKCVFCLYCHDFCPIFALFNEVSPIHPRHVGDSKEIKIDVSKVLERPVEISEDKIQSIMKILSINLDNIVKNKKKMK